MSQSIIQSIDKEIQAVGNTMSRLIQTKRVLEGKAPFMQIHAAAESKTQNVSKPKSTYWSRMTPAQRSAEVKRRLARRNKSKKQAKHGVTH